jgi:hypothetical protein
MKMFAQFIGMIVFLVGVTGCSTMNTLMVTAPIHEYPDLKVEFKENKNSANVELIHNVRVNDKKIISDTSEIKIISKKAGNVDLKISISDSYEPDAISKQIDPSMFAITNEINPSYSAYLIDIPTLEKSPPIGPIGHNNFLKISENTKNLSLILKRLDDTEWWPGLYSPILTRVSGDASLFELEDFAPSVGIGIVKKNNYIFSPKLSALVTIFQGTEVAEENKYSLALGPVVNFSGWLDIGTTYHFKDKKWLIVFGTTPQDLWQKLTPSKK